jgi:bifunctional DNA-binding transcriptional regulator/antitoxin component of YhaV-PrlF toxin-antitoxin module
MNIKAETTIVTERGQTSIPAHLRKEMHLGKGRRLVWKRVSPDELSVTVISARAADPLAMLGFARRFRKTRRTSTWMAELRAGERR